MSLTQTIYRKFNKKEKLDFYFQKTIYGDYSNRDVIRKGNLKRIIKRLLVYKKTKPLISTYFGGKHFPMLDVDSEELKQNLLERLSKTPYQYAIFSSSERLFIHANEETEKQTKYWVFLDIPCKKFKMAHNISRTLRFCDQKHLVFSFYNNAFFMRGFSDDESVQSSRTPKLIYNPTKNTSDLFSKFITELESYFDSNEFKLITELIEKWI